MEYKPQLKVSRGTTRLVVNSPFFGSMLLTMPVVKDADTETMSTDATKVYWGEAFVDRCTEEEVTGVLVHEVIHITNKHMFRRGDRDLLRWNYAVDYAANPIVLSIAEQTKTKSGKAIMALPEGALYEEQYLGMSAEAIYNRLPEDYELPEGAWVSGYMDAQNEDGSKPSPSEEAAMEANLSAKIMMAANSAKAVGKLPAEIKSVIDRMQRNQIRWEDSVQRFMGGDERDDRSMARPSRKIWGMTGMIMPSVVKRGAGHWVLGVDSSASVSDREIEYYIGGINAISNDLSPKSITVITCDARIQQVQTYEQGEEVTSVSAHGRGGTRVSPVFDYIAEKDLPCDNMVYFTDMDIYDYPDAKPDYPVMWVSSWVNGDPAPWGETVYLNTRG